jgi:hypothetical protein
MVPYGNKLAIKSNVLDPEKDWTQVQAGRIDTEDRTLTEKNIFISFYV